jgi:hypothetical protein
MDIQPLEILKWIGIVLAAGFVGYFGRYLAMLILDKTRRSKPEPNPASEPQGKVAAGGNSRLEESRLKLEKKRAKQAVKEAKKAGKG